MLHMVIVVMDTSKAAILILIASFSASAAAMFVVLGELLCCATEPIPEVGHDGVAIFLINDPPVFYLVFYQSSIIRTSTMGWFD